MLQSIARFSGQGPYAGLTQKLVNATQKMYQNNGSSQPELIAQTVLKIVQTKRPATRYRIGKWAKPMVWMRVYLGDRLFDNIVMSQV
jgi:hypothetical protein